MIDFHLIPIFFSVGNICHQNLEIGFQPIHCMLDSFHCIAVITDHHDFHAFALQFIKLYVGYLFPEGCNGGDMGIVIQFQFACKGYDIKIPSVRMTVSVSSGRMES